MGFETPEDILKEYNNGLQAATCDPLDMAKLMTELPHPRFGDVGNNLFETGKGLLSLPYKAIQKFFPNFGADERQDTGDCVAHSTRNAVDVTRCYEIVYKGERETFLSRGAVEPIYGCRGHGGQGMHCSQAARFVNLTGGFLARQKYGDFDLSNYNANIGISWGTKGIPKCIIEKCSEHKINLVTTVNSVEQARDLIANGYALSVCSNYGFSNIRDKNGISETDGSWAHAMAWIGCDDTRERSNEILFLVQNSWGIWNTGPRVHDQPEGSFWIRQSVAEGMIGARASFAYSDFNGFVKKVDWNKIREVYS